MISVIIVLEIWFILMSITFLSHKVFRTHLSFPVSLFPSLFVLISNNGVCYVIIAYLAAIHIHLWFFFFLSLSLFLSQQSHLPMHTQNLSLFLYYKNYDFLIISFETSLHKQYNKLIKISYTLKNIEKIYILYIYTYIIKLVQPKHWLCMLYASILEDSQSPRLCSKCSKTQSPVSKEEGQQHLFNAAINLKGLGSAGLMVQ